MRVIRYFASLPEDDKEWELYQLRYRALNFRREANLRNILVPETTNETILNIWHFAIHSEIQNVTCFVLACWVSGVTGFGYQKSEVFPLNSQNEIVPWQRIVLPSEEYSYLRDEG